MGVPVDEVEEEVLVDADEGGSGVCDSTGGTRVVADNGMREGEREGK